jgi:hypothetical protein
MKSPKRNFEYINLEAKHNNVAKINYDISPLVIREDMENIKKNAVSSFAGGASGKHFSGANTTPGSEKDDIESIKMITCCYIKIRVRMYQIR